MAKRRVPKQVFHYTSTSGLLGILQSRTLWASSIHYLNDAEDFGYALRLARTEVERFTLDPKLRRQLEMIISDPFPGARNIFVASFSEKRDLLSQWRGYCPEGRGVSIGFLTDMLIESASAQDFTFRPCIYNAGVHQLRVRQVLASCLRLHEAHKAKLKSFDQFLSGNQEYRRSLLGVPPAVRLFVKRMSELAPILKHPSFAEEKEWRLVGTPKRYADILLREGRSFLVPYREFRLTNSQDILRLGYVTVGPTPHPTLAVESVTSALVLHRVKRAGVFLSTSPYRAW